MFLVKFVELRLDVGELVELEVGKSLKGLLTERLLLVQLNLFFKELSSGELMKS
jgi:hypothetical protein